jgi:hypothetical protein
MAAPARAAKKAGAVARRCVDRCQLAGQGVSLLVPAVSRLGLAEVPHTPISRSAVATRDHVTEQSPRERAGGLELALAVAAPLKVVIAARVLVGEVQPDRGVGRLGPDERFRLMTPLAAHERNVSLYSLSARVIASVAESSVPVWYAVW